jgi:hypothetical protein
MEKISKQLKKMKEEEDESALYITSIVKDYITSFQNNRLASSVIREGFIRQSARAEGISTTIKNANIRTVENSRDSWFVFDKKTKLIQSYTNKRLSKLYGDKLASIANTIDEVLDSKTTTKKGKKGAKKSSSNIQSFTRDSEGFMSKYSNSEITLNDSIVETIDLSDGKFLIKSTSTKSALGISVPPPLEEEDSNTPIVEEVEEVDEVEGVETEQKTEQLIEPIKDDVLSYYS